MSATMTSDVESEPEVTPPNSPAARNALYLQLALTAGGNLLALLIVGVIYAGWRVLSDFRAALLW